MRAFGKSKWGREQWAIALLENLLPQRVTCLEIICCLWMIALYCSSSTSAQEKLQAASKAKPVNIAAPPGTAIEGTTIAKSAEIHQKREGKSQAKEANNALVDVKPPLIRILYPSITRGMKLAAETSSLTVLGLAGDESGIASVVINGRQATLSEPTHAQVQQYGKLSPNLRVIKFEGDATLSPGENTISITATDTRGNMAESTLTVVRKEALISPQAGDFIKGKYYAIIIAVQNYRDIDGLEYPIQDADNVISTLTTCYTFDKSNVSYLKNPDRKTIFMTLQQLKKKVTPEDNLLVYYAGHGFWDGDLSQGYWLPSNATWEDRAEWISNSDVRDYIKAIKTKHTLLISDACFSGGIFSSREARERSEASIEKMYELPSRKAITSGTLKTAVPDRSVFVEYLLKRLKENKEKYLYAEKLYLSFKEAVINNSPNGQTPQYGVIFGAGDEGGDFVFVRK